MILGCCVIFKLPCWSDEAGTVWVPVGSEAKARFTITILKIKHPTLLWACSLPPAAQHLLWAMQSISCSSLLTEQERKITAGSVCPSQGLLLPPSCCRDPTLLSCAHSLAAFSTGFTRAETRNGCSACLFSLLKIIVSKYFASKVMLVKQYLLNARPLEYLSFCKEKNYFEELSLGS